VRGIKRFDFLSKIVYNIYVKKRNKNKLKRRHTMARIDFTSLRESAQSFMASMEGALTDLLGIANAQRKELISLYQRMADTQADIKEFSEITAEVAETFDAITDVAEDVVVKVGNAIEGGADLTPECNYEDLAEFCDECGRAITNDEDYTEEAGGFVLCADCHPINDEDELEDEDGEQITIELAESVSTDNQ
jgi:hypothetical protein